MNRHKYYEDAIRQEAASQAINKTIRMVEQRLDIQIPKVGSPSENRELMIEIIRQHMN